MFHFIGDFLASLVHGEALRLPLTIAVTAFAAVVLILSFPVANHVGRARAVALLATWLLAATTLGAWVLPTTPNHAWGPATILATLAALVVTFLPIVRSARSEKGLQR